MFNIVDNELIGYEGNDSVIVIPSDVKAIKPLIFRNNINIREIDLSNTSIENLLTKTFFECKTVERIILPKTLKQIGYQAFSNCQSLYEIDIPTGVEVIEAGAFEECMNLTRIDLPGTITTINMNMFKNCSKLEFVYMSSGLVNIGESAFENCINLNTIDLPKTLNKLGMFAFKNCKKLSGIVIPEGIKMVPRGCFYKCSRLTMVFLPKTIEKLDDWSFRECTMLDKVSIPANCKVSPCAFLDSKTVNEPHFVDKIAVPKKQKCYIATCVYGTYDTKELYVLRRYRDKALRRTWYGRLFIKWYYFNAPIVIKLFGKMKWFNKMWKRYLDKKVDKLVKRGYLDTEYIDIEL